MQKHLFIAVIALATVGGVPQTAQAQIRKEVEVTKEYVPSVEPAPKLPIAPDMTDSTHMRPEVAHAVTPYLLDTSLELQPIRPASVTFWTFNRPEPCYLKFGAGYPLNSLADFYFATQHPNTGYVRTYLNHTGRYADIRNDFGQTHNSLQTDNRVGAAAGKYIGRRVIEAAASYENRLYHRYGGYALPSVASESAAAPGARIDYGDADFAFRIGDDFQDLSRVNFELAASYNLFFDQSIWANFGNRPRQTTIHANGKLARAFGQHHFSLEAGYDRFDGQRAIADFREHLIWGAARYGAESRTLHFEVGADYYHDRIDGQKHRNYILPFARLHFDLGTQKLRPFLEVDGSLHDNSYRSLTRACPYVEPATLQYKSSVDYDSRLGISGDLWRERFVYRLYAAFSVHRNHNYWYATGLYDAEQQQLVAAACSLHPAQLRQTVTSFHGEIDFHPVSSLRMELGLHACLYNDDPDFDNGEPALKGNFGIRYAMKQVSFGISLSGQTARKWTLRYTDIVSGDTGKQTFEAPASLDLQVMFDWRISKLIGIFAEGGNLLNRRLYRFPWYPEYGANCTVGVKFTF